MKERLVNDRYRIIVPDHIADWDAPSEWERQRFLSMEKNLRKDDLLLDVGTEQGWQSAIYARFCPNIILVEPDKNAWPNIRKTWEANNLPDPFLCFVGSLGTKTTGEPESLWPKESQGELQTSLGYGSINNGKVMKIDDFISKPTAITIDVEGAELEVVRGGKKLLYEHKPKLWISVHSDLMEKDYGSNDSQLRKVLTDLNYEIEDLGWDGHETHWYCS